MKSRNIVVIVVIAALLVAYYWLGTGYLKERRQNNTLSANISETMLALAALPAPDPDWQQRLEAVRAELDMTLSIFPPEPNTTEIINDILQTAEDIGLKAIPLVTRPWVTETVDDYPVAVFRLNLLATGTSAQFADFLEYLENSETETMVIEYLTINREDETPLQECLAESPARILADLDLAIYAQAPEDE